MTKLNLKAKYPQNFIIRKPVSGALVLFVFCLGFTLLYQPLDAQNSRWFNFEITMVLYSLSASFAAWMLIVLLKRIRFFINKNDWTFTKELISAYLVLQVMGLAIFLTAFILESPADESRWNLLTFIDSCKYSFLIGIFPFAFFTAVNYRHWFRDGGSREPESNHSVEAEPLIKINSSLKKETLSFRASEFLFVMSDGNYVVFYLLRNNEVRKIPIRNSISNIHNQFAAYPDFFRCHRAFIVNMMNVVRQKGNALGYQLSIANCGEKVPVSRQNVKAFDAMLSKYLQ